MDLSKYTFSNRMESNNVNYVFLDMINLYWGDYGSNIATRMIYEMLRHYSLIKKLW